MHIRIIITNIIITAKRVLDTSSLKDEFATADTSVSEGAKLLLPTNAVCVVLGELSR